MAAVCDPLEQSEAYLRISQETGTKIRYVIDTHLHADHVSGGRKLAEATGANYVLHASAGARFRFHGVSENDELSLGNVQIRLLHTPGHTPEHISLLVIDKTRGPEPWFVLSGHTLMVGDLGRTELASSAEEGARALFGSVHASRLPRSAAGSIFGISVRTLAERLVGLES